MNLPHDQVSSATKTGTNLEKHSRHQEESNHKKFRRRSRAEQPMSNQFNNNNNMLQAHGRESLNVRSGRVQETSAKKLMLAGLAVLFIGLVLAPLGRDELEGAQQVRKGSQWPFVMLAHANSNNNNNNNINNNNFQQQQHSTAVQNVLLDTTEQSSLGWTKYPDGGPQTRTPGWVEESFTNFERGINWRSFVVCDVAFNSVNNWLWTPFIERPAHANRLYIEIKFTMRDCNLFPNMVLSCKETFGLLYKEADEPIELESNGAAASNASFAQAADFKLVDAIAADVGRFTSNTDVVINTEIRSIPVSRRGVYFAFRDQGACLSLISIRVYQLECPGVVANFARFNATPTGRDLSSLVAAEGECVPNAVQVEPPKMYCSADGQWTQMAGGQCKCAPGFEPAAQNAACRACPPGKFKPQAGDAPCLPCPEHSHAPAAGASECRCHEGFHRAGRDPRHSGCGQAPGAPTNLTGQLLDHSTLLLNWSPPLGVGNHQPRDDLVYRLICADQCGGGPAMGAPDAATPTHLVSSPPAALYANFSETRCVLAGLAPSSSYRFLVYALNGVSQLSPNPPRYTEITLETPPPPQQPVPPLAGPLHNFRATPGVRGSDMLLSWDLLPGSRSPPASSADLSVDLASPSEPPSLFEVRAQVRGPAHQRDFRSPYPASLLVGPSSSVHEDRLLQLNSPQSLTTTNPRAALLANLSPLTEYAFQVRSKPALNPFGPHSQQQLWSDFSEPIVASTGSGPITRQPVEAHFGSGDSLELSAAANDPFQAMSNQLRFIGPPGSGSSAPTASGGPNGVSSSGGWLSTLLLLLLCGLVSLALISFTLLHYRKSGHAHSHHGSPFAFGPFAGFGGASASGSGGAGSAGHASAASTYGGLYGSGAASSADLMGASVFGSSAHHAHHLTLHHPSMSGGSAGGLITGTNGGGGHLSSGRSAGNVVQNFIAATLGQISGNHNSNQVQSHQQQQQQQLMKQQNHLQQNQNSPNGSATMSAGSKLAFGSSGSPSLLSTVINGPNLHTQTNIRGLGTRAGSNNNFYTHQQSAGMLLGGGGEHQSTIIQPYGTIYANNTTTINGLNHHHHHHQQQQQQQQNYNHHLQQQQQQHQQQQQQQSHLFATSNNNTNNNNKRGAPNELQLQQDPQLHIYDDLEAATAGTAGCSFRDLEPQQQVRIESVIERGKFRTHLSAFE